MDEQGDGLKNIMHQNVEKLRLAKDAHMDDIPERNSFKTRSWARIS